MKHLLLSIAAGFLAITLLISLNTQIRRAAAAELALTEGTLAAVADASSELSTLILQLEKLLVSGSQEQYASLLAGIALGADRVQRSIAALPDAQGERTATMAFLSDLSSQAQSLLTSLADSGAISDLDRFNISHSLEGLRLLQAEVAFAQQGLHAGEDVTQALQPAITAKPTAMELANYQALPSGAVGSGMALQLAKEFVGIDRVVSVSHAPDTSGALPAFGVTIQTADVQLNLEITRQGGKVLLMAPETASFPIRLTPEQCIGAAIAFLHSRGFPTMEALYYQIYDGLCVATCTYVQNDVLVWADRILVQVRMDTGEVVGLEARSFWKNHIPRKIAAPLISEQEARQSLSGSVSILHSRMCLLPHRGQERLCYQFTITFGDETFVSYIDAFTGQELLLEKVILLENGSLAA